VFDAMALQIAKGIACLAASLSGDVDAVLLTGGMARSRCLVEAVAGRVAFVAPLRVYPGEGERLALAEGALRVLRGQEEARTIPL
jgi:butyrate kinase